MIQQQQEYLSQPQLSPQPRLLLFQNAVYQGGCSDAAKVITGNGFVYFPSNKNIIICSNFTNGLLHNYALCYHHSRKYLYGSWKLNKLHGTAVFRMENMVIIAQFVNGVIKKSVNVIVLLDDNKIGSLVQVNEFGYWVLQRKEIHCNQHILQLMQKSQFTTSNISLSLISFLNQSIALQKNQSARLRLLKNGYQYAFRRGIAATFDAQGQLTSLKLNQCLLQPTPKHQSMQTIKDMLNDKNAKLIIAESGKIYHRKQGTKESILAKQLEDPSQDYFSYFQKVFNQAFRKKTRAGLLIIKSKTSSPANFKQQSMLLDPDIIKHDQQEQSHLIQLKQSKLQFQFKQAEDDQITQFQTLVPSNRLRVIKKQQYQLLQHKIIRQRAASYSAEGRQEFENIQKQKQITKNTEGMYQFKRLQDQESQTNALQAYAYSNISPANENLNNSPQSKKRKRQKIFQNLPTTHTVYKNYQGTKDQEKNDYIGKKQLFLKQTENRLQIHSEKDEKYDIQVNFDFRQKEPHKEFPQSRRENEFEQLRIINNTSCSPSKFKMSQRDSLYATLHQPTQISPSITKQGKQLPIFYQKQNYDSSPHFYAIQRSKQSPQPKGYSYTRDESKDNKLHFDYVIH